MDEKRKVIDRFNLDNKFLSNFAASTIYYDGRSWPTVEHAYQAMKTLDFDEQEFVRSSISPSQAKKRGKSVTLRDDWSDVRIDIMRELLKLKFQNPFLRQKLIDTGDALLIEGNTWGDVIWGVCNGKGENNLGLLLMQLRDEVIKEEAISKEFWDGESRK